MRDPNSIPFDFNKISSVLEDLGKFTKHIDEYFATLINQTSLDHLAVIDHNLAAIENWKRKLTTISEKTHSMHFDSLLQKKENNDNEFVSVNEARNLITNGNGKPMSRKALINYANRKVDPLNATRKPNGDVRGFFRKDINDFLMNGRKISKDN